MWSSWTESAKASLQQALDKTSDALEKTGDALTQAAVQARHTSAATTTTDEKDKNPATTTTASSTLLSSFPAATTITAPTTTSLTWTSVVESTKALGEKATQLAQESQAKFQREYQKAQQLAAEQARQAQLRPTSLPLDVAALQDLQVVYITDRILTCRHPAMASSENGDLTPPRQLAALGQLLHKRHAGRFLVWNLSEVEYDEAAALYLDHQVLNYSFPGSPSPPLGLLLKLLTSLESWLRADAQNVAVVHCLTGKGRTSLVVAAFLGWMAEAGFGDIREALSYIAKCKQISVDDLTIPSQRRYASYFTNMLEDSIRPSQPPLLITRVILSQPPRFARGPGRNPNNQGDGTAADNKDGGEEGGKNDDNNNHNNSETSSSWKEDDFWGCAPYLQLFKGGQLVFTAPASRSYSEQEDQEKDGDKTPTDDKDDKEKKTTENSTAATPPNRHKKESLPFCHAGDGSVSFHVNQIVQGDVLLRCRHLTAKRQRVSMFRAAFHTGYMGNNSVLRLTKSQLDGACNDHQRFADDFYVDVLLEPVDAEEAGKLLQKTQDIPTPEETEQVVDGQETSKKTTTVTATAYDTMLDRDSRFWDVIEKRRQAQKEQEQKTKAADEAAATYHDIIHDPNYGPTVGRRRTWGAPEGAKLAAAGGSGGKTTSSGSGGDTFSIGGDMDFLPQESSSNDAATAAAAAPPKKKEPRVRDSLMDALTGALDDDDLGDEEDEEHEVVFFDAGAAASSGKESEQKAAEAATAMTTDASQPTTATEANAQGTTTTVDATPNTAAAAAATETASSSVTSTSQQDSAVVVDAMDATPPDDDDDELLITANLSLDDDDMNALLGAGAEDDLDADLEDLENLLAQK
mmetsp:Transcript_29443/g.80884  ORF Transcript_29443/g.80884 Transcript_29443/m.80884 type:complete len:860 (-) Transcript_29443:112-2691(-)